ncbi:putative holin-like toxin [Pseudalkalibacillus caeni]|nr:putative holin-like toxin [Pseudalkalibacillus caeni]
MLTVFETLSLMISFSMLVIVLLQSNDKSS